jgi:hypothetical protein
MKRDTDKNRWGAATPTAVHIGKDFTMSTLLESQFNNKCLLSEQLAANLQPFIGLLESDWQRLRFTMDPFTEALFRQVHEASAKLYETHVFMREGGGQ